MLRRFREEYNLSETDKLTYAGRLDPMAAGIVPILVGDARFQKDHLLGANKTYEVDIVLGLSTDTGDLLGIITDKTIVVRKDLTTKGLAEIKEAVRQLSEIKELTYPNYSSRPVDGKPLFMHARAGKSVQLPIKKITIHSMEMIDIKEVSLNELLSEAIETIKKVQGDFRQEEIIGQWFKMISEEKIQIVTIRTTVSSGTYMRSLAEKIGELLGVPALAGRIVRTNIEEKK
jgi:tRNA pseudouridine55 synthase